MLAVVYSFIISSLILTWLNEARDEQSKTNILSALVSYSTAHLHCDHHQNQTALHLDDEKKLR